MMGHMKVYLCASRCFLWCLYKMIFFKILICSLIRVHQCILIHSILLATRIAWKLFLPIILMLSGSSLACLYSFRLQKIWRNTMLYCLINTINWVILCNISALCHVIMYYDFYWIHHKCLRHQYHTQPILKYALKVLLLWIHLIQ